MSGVEVFAALGALGTVVSAVSQFSQGQAQARNAKFQAALARQTAQREREIARREAEDFRRRGSRIRAASRARRSASGVVPSEGTSLLIDSDLAEEIERGAGLIEAGGQARASRLEAEAALNSRRARSARVGSAFSAGSSLLTGASRFGGAFFGSPSPPVGVPQGGPGRGPDIRGRRLPQF